MPLNLEALSDVIAMAVNDAVAPLKTQLALAESKMAALAGLEQTVTAFRERLVVAETKSALLTAPIAPPAVDLSPLTERLTAVERKQFDVVELGKSIGLQIKSLEERPPAEDVTGLRDRLIAIETKAAGLETRLSAPDPLGASVEETKRAVADLAKDVSSLRERVAVVEVRPPVPGPPGEPGPPGKDGLDGKDGSAGLSFEGVYQEGQTYEKGMLATWAGSSWHCNESTASKPGESKAWTLMVKRGRDGKDGKDAVPLPVVTVGASRG